MTRAERLGLGLKLGLCSLPLLIGCLVVAHVCVCGRVHHSWPAEALFHEPTLLAPGPLPPSFLICASFVVTASRLPSITNYLVVGLWLVSGQLVC